MNTRENILEVLKRMEIRKKNCYVDKNPYYESPQGEWLDLTIKIKELKAKLKKQ